MNDGRARLFRHEAMASPWECHLIHSDAEVSGQAAREAFAIVDGVEAQLSRFRADSDTGLIGRLKPGRLLQVRAATFECLELGLAVHAETGGAFDLTITPLYDADRCGSRGVIGMEHLEIDGPRQGVAVRRAPVFLDFGAIGKGYALDLAAAALADWEIEGWFLVAGGSTMLAGGIAPGAEGWPIGLPEGGSRTYHLKDEAMSTSGFEVRGHHIWDPRTREAVRGSRRHAWVFAPSAALADAVSTAVMVMSESEIEAFCRRHTEIGIVTGETGASPPEAP